jgi:hypothetical protein
VTDGTTTYSSVAELEFSGRLQVSPGSGGSTLVQSNHANNSVTLPDSVTIGNFILAIWIGNVPPATLGGMPQLALSTGGATEASAIYGQYSTSTTPPTCSVGSSIIYMAEVANVTGFSVGNYTPGGTSPNHTGAFSLGPTDGLVFYTGNTSSNYVAGEATSFTPSGTSVLDVPFTSGATFGAFIAHVAGAESSTSSVSWQDSTNAYRNSCYIGFAGAPTSFIVIDDPLIPVTVNGTLESGGLSALSISTGNTATSVSFTSGTLVINLGTP